MIEEIIESEKTDEEIMNTCEIIIDKLKSFNPVDKFRVIDALHVSLIDNLKQFGIIIKEEKL